MEGHSRICVERYCELANQKTEQLYKVSHPLNDHQITKEELENEGGLSEVFSILCLNAYIWHEFVDLTFCGQSTH